MAEKPKAWVTSVALALFCLSSPNCTTAAPPQSTAVASAPVAGVTYVVDQGNPKASDANNGIDQPLLTISKAVKSLQPGDTVLIKAGIYREEVAFAASGTSDKPITIAAAPGDEGKVIISGSDIAKPKHLAGVVWTIPFALTFDSRYPEIWISKFTEADYGPLARRCEMVFVDGKGLQQVLGNGLIYRGAFAVDETRHVIRLGTFEDEPAPQFEVAVRQHGLEIKGSHLIIRGITVEHVANPYEIGALSVIGDDNRLENCSAEWNNLDGIRFGGHRIHATGNISEHNGDCGMCLAIQDSRLENNQTNYNSWRMGPGWHEGGVKIIGGNPANNVVIDHVSKGNRGSGIWFDTCGSGNRIERCRLEGNMIAGIDIEASLGSSASPNVIINNVISDTHDIPNALWPQAGGAGIMLYESGDVSILNNTLVDNDHFAIAFCGAQRKNGGYCHDIELHNNILAGNGNAGVSFWMHGKASDPAVLATYHSDENVWDQPEGKLAIFPSGAITNLAQLQKDAGWDAHSIAGDPHFVSAKDGNYQLAPDSPCIGKGCDIKEIPSVDGTHPF